MLRGIHRGKLSTSLKMGIIYWTKKERYHLGDITFLSSHWKWIYGIKILLTAIFHIGLYHKFRDQSSVKGLSRQWVEFQKVRAGRILTTTISMCVDRRYLYFFYHLLFFHCTFHTHIKWYFFLEKHIASTWSYCISTFCSHCSPF